MLRQLLAPERLRLVAVALALVPVAIAARALGSDWLTEYVQRAGARAWARYDESRPGTIGP